VRLLPLALAALLPACGNTYHPEYHPVSQVHYQQSLSYPVSVHPAAGQQVVVAPAPGVAPIAPMPPPRMPPLAPPPKEMDPSEMW
jgi:hypothetical protein